MCACCIKMCAIWTVGRHRNYWVGIEPGWTYCGYTLYHPLIARPHWQLPARRSLTVSSCKQQPVDDINDGMASHLTECICDVVCCCCCCHHAGLSCLCWLMTPPTPHCLWAQYTTRASEEASGPRLHSGKFTPRSCGGAPCPGFVTSALWPDGQVASAGHVQGFKVAWWLGLDMLPLELQAVLTS